MPTNIQTSFRRSNLARLNINVQRRTIQPARDALQTYLANALPTFAYPAGSYDDTTLDLLQEPGYAAAVMTRQGILQSSAQPFELKRIRVRGA